MLLQGETNPDVRVGLDMSWRGGCAGIGYDGHVDEISYPKGTEVLIV